MTNDATGGVSKRSLVLLGGLAALALNRDTRRALVSSTAQAWHDAGTTLDGRVKPALAQAASQAQDLAAEAARRSAAGLDTIREEVPFRAQSLLGTAIETAGTLAHTAQDGASTLLDSAQTAGKQGSKQARRALRSARSTASSTLDDVVKPVLAQAQDAGLGLLATVQETLGEGGDAVAVKRRQMEKTVARARRDAEKDLRAARRAWKPKKLQKAVDRRVAGVQKTLSRELLVLEKQARRARRDDHGGRPGSAVTAAILLGTGAVVLARLPVARQGILNAVGSVSPDAADALHRAGRTVRNVVGSVWMERLEEPKAPPAAAATAQVGSAAGSAPDQPTHRQDAPGESKADTSKN